MKEWMEQLKVHLAEEARDHEEYMALAAKAEETGDYCEAGVLRDIACEEKTHKNLIKEMINGHETGHMS